MFRTGIALLTLVVFGVTGVAGDIEVNAPYTTVRLDKSGRPVEVIAPFTHVRVNGGVRVVAPHTDVQVETKPATPAQPGEPIHAPRISAPAPIVAMSHYDFGHSFNPVAGNYEVYLIHPRTGCPVRVCFSLPCGCPKVEVRCDEIEFDYGKREVEIEFRKNGRVVVEYN